MRKQMLTVLDQKPGLDQRFPGSGHLSGNRGRSITWECKLTGSGLTALNEKVQLVY